MDKVLGQEYGNIAERTAFLRDNCDAEGVLVYQRPARPEEKSPNVFRLQRTGTNG